MTCTIKNEDLEQAAQELQNEGRIVAPGSILLRARVIAKARYDSEKPTLRDLQPIKITYRDLEPIK